VEKRPEFLGCVGLPLRLPEHPDEHRSQRPVLLAVDQQLGEFVGPIPRALNVPEAFRPLTDTIVVRDGVKIRARNVRRGCSGALGLFL
jgi:hypothetical protein